MRILWISHRCPNHPQAGGAEVHLREVGGRLVKMGHSVTVLAERFNGARPQEQIDGMTILRMGGRLTLHLHVPYHLLRNQDRYDVVVDDVAHAVPFGSPRFTKKPVVGIVHHVHQQVVGVEVQPVLRQLIRWAERSIQGNYKNILAVSQTTRRDLIEQIGVEASRITVIYYGIDHERYRPGTKSDEPTILWIGRMKKYKNVDRIIEAFKTVRKSVKNARLVLAGTGDQWEELQKMVSRENIDGVKFVGKVVGDKKIDLLQRSWCVIYASEIEGWGMGVLEASACGTPAVAYDSGALSEAIVDQQTGLLANYGNIFELSQNLVRIIQDEPLRRRLSENALKHSFNFSWEKAATQTAEYLESLI